jgi:hypothetical protein
MTFYVQPFLEKSFSRPRQSGIFVQQKAQNEYPMSQKMSLQELGNTGIIDSRHRPSRIFAV